MNQVVAFPSKAKQAGPTTIHISGYWNGPVYQSEVTSDGAEADADDPRIATTFAFDEAVRAAHGYAHSLGYESVRFTLSTEDMHGGSA